MESEFFYGLIQKIVADPDFLGKLDLPYQLTYEQIGHLKEMVKDENFFTEPAKGTAAFNTFLLIHDKIFPKIMERWRATAGGADDMAQTEDDNARLISRSIDSETEDDADVVMQELERVFGGQHNNLHYEFAPDNKTITIDYLEKDAEQVSEQIDTALIRAQKRIEAMGQVEKTCESVTNIAGRNALELEYINRLIRETKEALKKMTDIEQDELVQGAIMKCKDKAKSIQTRLDAKRAADAADVAEAAKLAAELENTQRRQAEVNQRQRQQKQAKKCQAGIRLAAQQYNYDTTIDFMATLSSEEKAAFDRLLDDCHGGAIAVFEMRKLKEAKNTCRRRIVEIASRFQKDPLELSFIDQYTPDTIDSCYSDYASRLASTCQIGHTNFNNDDIEQVYQLCSNVNNPVPSNTQENTERNTERNTELDIDSGTEFYFHADDTTRHADASNNVRNAVMILTTEPQDKTFAFDQMTERVATKAANVINTTNDAATVIIDALHFIGQLVSENKVYRATRIMGAVRQFNKIMSNRLKQPVLTGNDRIDYSDIDMYLGYLVQFKLMLARKKQADQKLLDTPLTEISKIYKRPDYSANSANYTARRKTPRR